MNRPMKLNADPDIIDYLPDSVRDLVDVVGLSAALAIVNARGGWRLKVPKSARPDHWLAELIGLDQLARLADIYGGDEIEIPRCAAALRRLRDVEIEKSAAAGMTNAQLAIKYGYTERGIRKLLQRVREADANRRQMNLFCQ